MSRNVTCQRICIEYNDIQWFVRIYIKIRNVDKLLYTVSWQTIIYMGECQHVCLISCWGSQSSVGQGWASLKIWAMCTAEWYCRLFQKPLISFTTKKKLPIKQLTHIVYYILYMWYSTNNKCIYIYIIYNIYIYIIHIIHTYIFQYTKIITSFRSLLSQKRSLLWTPMGCISWTDASARLLRTFSQLCNVGQNV